MGAKRIEVLRGVEAGTEGGDRGAQRGVGDRGLDWRDRVQDGGGVLGLDLAERATATGPQALDEARLGQQGVVVGRGPEPVAAVASARRRSWSRRTSAR